MNKNMLIVLVAGGFIHGMFISPTGVGNVWHYVFGIAVGMITQGYVE